MLLRKCLACASFKAIQGNWDQHGVGAWHYGLRLSINILPTGYRPMAYKSKKISRLVWYPLPNVFVQWDLPFDKLDKDIYQPKIHDHMAESMNKSPKNWKFNAIIILAGGFSSKPWYMFFIIRQGTKSLRLENCQCWSRSFTMCPCYIRISYQRVSLDRKKTIRLHILICHDCAPTGWLLK